MLPDKEEVSTPVMETKEPVQVEVPAPEPTPEKPPKGYVPLQALEEERRKRKEVQEKLEAKTLQTPEYTDEDLSDEGRLLSRQLAEANKRIDSLLERTELQKLTTTYPQLDKNREEFDEFRSEYQGVPLEKVAKLFLSEKGLNDSPPRKGLERPTGGSKPIPQSGISSEDVRRLREEQPRKWLKAISEGKINPDNIE